MAAFEIELWFSRRGTPHSYSLLESLPEVLGFDGQPIDGVATYYTWENFIPGQRYWFKSRRVYYADGQPAVYSAFTLPVEVRAPIEYRARGNDMDPVITSDTSMAVGLQSYGEPHDKPRRPQYIVESTGGNIRAELMTVVSRANKRTTARRHKTAAGRANFAGTVPFEVTPNGPLPRFLCMMLGEPVTTILGGTVVTTTANAAQGAVTIPVSALVKALPVGTSLNFSTPRTVSATGNANLAGDTALDVAPLPGAITTNTILTYDGYYFRATAPAATGAVVVTVTPLPVTIPAGGVISYTENRLATLTAPGLIGDVAITVSALASAIPSGATATQGQKYKHVWKNTKKYVPGTIAQYMGNFVRVHPGVFVNTFELGVEKEQENFITASLGLMALNHLNGYSLTSSGMDAALTDNLDGFTAIDAILVIDGAESEEAREATVTLNRNGRAKNVLNRRRGATRNYPVIMDANMACRMFFTNDYLRQKYFGLLFNPEAPGEEIEGWGATRQLPTVSVSLEFATEPFPGELPYELNFRFPRATMETVDEPVGAQGEEVFQEVNFLPEVDTSVGTDVIIEVVCDESKEDIMNPGSAITPVQANSVTKYESV